MVMNDELLMYLARLEVNQRLVAAEQKRLVRTVLSEREGGRRDG